MPDRPWEHGSGFAFPEIAPEIAGPSLPEGASYWHSGRHALRALVQALAPARVWFPSFYCQMVFDAAEGAEVLVYGDEPAQRRIVEDSIELRSGDLLVVSNTYGLREKSPVGATPSSVTVVEDHTHDPFSRWARESSASYAFASLRKWLPLPDGAMLWSPVGLPVRAAPTFDGQVHAAAAAATLNCISAMLLKQRYLAGARLTTASFRELAVAGENATGSGAPAPISPLSRAMLDLLPAASWRATRRRNHDALVDGLGPLDGVTVLSAVAGNDGLTPFALILRFDDPARRDAVRAALVAEAVYPAVLWPLESECIPGTSAAAVDLSRRVLCVHCDHRYSGADIKRVAATVRGIILAHS